MGILLFNPLARSEQQSSELTEVRDVILQSWNRSKANEELNPMIPWLNKKYLG